MSEDSSQRSNLPLWLRIILKIPMLSLDGFSERFKGYFWIIVPAVFLVSLFWSNAAIIICLLFPWNAILFISVNTLIAVLFMRILLERALRTEEAIAKEGHFRWDVEKAFGDYISMLEPKKAEDSKDG